MKIFSITNLRMDSVKLTVNGIKYELKATKIIDGKKFRYYKSKPSKAEAETSAGKIRKRGLADKTSIIKHSSGAYMIYRFKDWKKAIKETAKLSEKRNGSNG